MALVTVCLSHAASSDPLKVELDPVDVMPDMEVEWVGRQMVYNGVPMSIRNFKTSKSSDDVLRYYERIWQAKSTGRPIRSKHGEFETIGLKDREFYYTVQARDGGHGSEGTLVVTSALDRYAPNRDTEFPLVPGATVITKIDALDRGVRAETLILVSERPIQAVDAWFQDALAREGWLRQSFSEAEMGKQRVLHFQRASQVCQVTVVGDGPLHDGRTMVLVNWVKG